MNLNEYLKTAQPASFKPKPFYSSDADTLTYFLRDAEYYATRIDELVTIYLSTDKNELVGCKIKGVKRILERLGAFGVEIEDDGTYFRLGPFFLAGMVDADKDKRPEYERLGRATRNVRVDRRELQPV